MIEINIEHYKDILEKELNRIFMFETGLLDTPLLMKCIKDDFTKRIKGDLFLDYDIKHIQLCVPINFDEVYKMIEETVMEFAKEYYEERGVKYEKTK